MINIKSQYFQYTNKLFIKVLLTIALLLLTLVLGTRFWQIYMNGPWTRDGRILANVISISPDVSGLITNVYVKDNQFVHNGDLLFKIDSVRYEEAFQEANALVMKREAEYKTKHQQALRRSSLNDQVISQESKNDSQLEEIASKASLEEALAQKDIAKTNLERTQVKASVDVWISNLNLFVGEQIKIGQPALSLIDAHSFWVYGYFEENRLPSIHQGDQATMTLMGTSLELKGEVESIASAIVDRDNQATKGGVANVNPNFSWVRLAQRVPVRIHLDSIPSHIHLASGMSCSIRIQPHR